MEHKKTERLKLLLRQLQLPTPPDGFTEEVMHEMTFLQSEQATVNDRLRKVLQDGRLTEPPTNFTYNVQQGIRESEQLAIKPVISRGVWISVGLFLGACVVIALTYPTGNTSSDTLLYFSWVADHLIGWMSSFQEPMLYFEAIVLSAGMLLGLEKILRNAFDWRRT